MPKLFSTVLAFVFVHSIAFKAFAQEGATASEIRGNAGQKTFQENYEITDERLRAESGALTRFSLKVNLSYFGPPVADLSAKDQPNPDGIVGSYQTAIGGNAGGQMRLSKRSSVGLSTGFKMIHPFQDTGRTDVNNPMMSYTFADRYSGIQMRMMPAVIVRTVPDFIRIGQFAYLLTSVSALYDVSGTNISFGGDFAIAKFLYNQDYSKSHGKASDLSVDIGPQAKYRLSSNMSTVASVTIPFVRLRSSSSFQVRTLTSKVGLSYALARDIYINPYISLFPQAPDWKTASINVASVVSVF